MAHTGMLVIYYCYFLYALETVCFGCTGSDTVLIGKATLHSHINCDQSPSRRCGSGWSGLQSTATGDDG